MVQFTIIMTSTQLDLFGSLPKPPLKIREEEDITENKGSIAQQKQDTESSLQEPALPLMNDAIPETTAQTTHETNKFPSGDLVVKTKPTSTSAHISVLPHDASNTGNQQGSIHVMMPATKQNIIEGPDSTEDEKQILSNDLGEIETLSSKASFVPPDTGGLAESKHDDTAILPSIAAETAPFLPELSDDGEIPVIEEIIEVQGDTNVNTEENDHEPENTSSNNDEQVLEENEIDLGIDHDEYIPPPEVIDPTDAVVTNVTAETDTLISAEKTENEAKGVPADDDLFKRQYYTMRETAAMFGVNQSLLRFWENEFSILKPKKNKKGDRYFRPADIKNLQLIYHLLKVRKFTIDGARDYLKNNNKALDTFELLQKLEKLKGFLQELTT